jgi:hypothetical protein
MIFRREPTDPIIRVEAELVKCQEREIALAAQLKAAIEAIGRAASARRDALLDEDSAVLSAANAELRKASDRESDLRDALALATEKRQVAERELTELKDKAARAEAAAELQKIRADIETKLDAHVQSARGLFEALQSVNIGHGLAAQLDVGTASLRTEIAAQALRVLDRQIEAIAAGTLPVPREQPPPSPVPEPIARVSTYLTESAKWNDPEHGRSSATKFAIVELPEQAARRARELGIGLDPAESIRLQVTHGRHFGPDTRYASDRLHDLDAPAESSEAA